MNRRPDSVLLRVQPQRVGEGERKIEGTAPHASDVNSREASRSSGAVGGSQKTIQHTTPVITRPNARAISFAYRTRRVYQYIAVPLTRWAGSSPARGEISLALF